MEGLANSSTFSELIEAKPNHIKINSDPLGSTRIDNKGNLYIGSKNTNGQILDMAWELTNSANAGRLNLARFDTAGSKQEYTMRILRIEAEAVMNRALVAEELGISDPGTSYANDWIKQHREGKLTENEVIELISQTLYEVGEVTKQDGTKASAQDAYGEQYDNQVDANKKASESKKGKKK